MPAICALDHVNIRVESLARTTRFYQDVLGMTVTAIPGMEDKPDAWICDAEGRAILHVGESAIVASGAVTQAIVEGPGGGSIHHVALDCVGHDEMLARLRELGVRFDRNRVDSVSLDQIFLRDPDGVLLELNFRRG